MLKSATETRPSLKLLTKTTGDQLLNSEKERNKKNRNNDAEAPLILKVKILGQ